MEKKLKCEICKKEFLTECKTKKYCPKCEKKVKNERMKRRRYEHNNNKNKNKKEGIDYVVCQICGEKCARIYGQHLKSSHNMTSAEYKKMFPDVKMHSEKDKYNISKNSGKYMKEDKYRKMFSEMFKGENNPNHKSKTTEQHRKEISPFSKEFYKKRGLTEEDYKKFIKNVSENRKYTTQLDYWINKGYSENEAKVALSERQSTFTLKKCIEKYGEEDGLKKWKERQEKWKAKVFNKDTHIGRGESLLSEEIIKEILYYNKNNEKLLYGKCEKFIYDSINKHAYKFDLTNENNKRIIEVNGIFWHCKPDIYKPDYFHKVKKITANDIWNYDSRKKETANAHGYDVLVIWEDDFYNNPEYIIKKCIDFIYEEIT
jgi:hypothetical protein